MLSERLNAKMLANYDGKHRNIWCATGLWIGVASIVLAEIGIIPLTGLIICIIGLVKFDKEKHKSLWMGVIGLILNFMYLIVNAHLNGVFG